MKTMVDEFRKTLFKVIHLRSIIGYNGLVFALKNTPLIGNLLPNRLYSTTALKVIYWIFHVIKEMFFLFIGKIAGLGAVYLVAWFMETEYIDYGLNEGESASVLFGARRGRRCTSSAVVAYSLTRIGLPSSSDSLILSLVS